MGELDLEALQRLEGDWRSQGEGPLVTRACWNEVRRQLPAIIAALERDQRLWRCGAGHIVEVEAGTPPYEISCPICAALEAADALARAAQVAVDGDNPFLRQQLTELDRAIRVYLESKP